MVRRPSSLIPLIPLESKRTASPTGETGRMNYHDKPESV
jgi:hypothetical protein